MLFRYCIVLSTAAVLLCALPVFGQKPGGPDSYILVNTLNDNSGLPQNSIIGQYIDTSSGMLWLATFSGLVRYNGVAVKNFTNGTTPALRSNQMVCLFKTVDGKVFGMNSLSQILPISNQGFEVSDHYSTLFGKFEGFIWFKGILQSLDQIRQIAMTDLGKPEYYPGQSTWVQNAANYYVTSLPGDRMAVVNRSNELLIYKDREIVGSYKIPDAKTAEVVYSNGFLYVLDDALEGLCFKVEGSGALVPVPDFISSDLQAFKKQAAGSGKLYYNELNDQLTWQVDHSIYLLHTGAGAVTLQNTFQLSMMPQSISSISYVDRHHVLFIGTTTEGLYVYRKNNFFQWRTDEPVPDINSNYSQILINENILRTNRGVLYDLAERSVTMQPQKRNNIWSAFSKDTNGDIYMNDDDSVFRYSPATNTYQALYGYERIANVGHNIIKYCHFDTTTGRLWIMEKKRWGYLFNGGYYPVIPYQAEEIPTPCYFSKKNDTIVLATIKGVLVVNETTNKWSIIPDTKGKETRFVQSDRNKRYCWVGTYGHGYGIIDLQEMRTTWLPRDPKDYLMNVHALIEDHKGYIWATTNKGLFRFSREQLFQYFHQQLPGVSYDYFDRQDGLYTNEFNGGGQPIYNWWGDQLLMSAINGITMFRPDAISPYGWDEPVYIDYAQTKNRDDIQPGADSSWHFEANERNIRWIVNKACWHNPYSLRIEYRVDDTQQWKVATEIPGIISLESLSPGKHVLQIRSFVGVSSPRHVEQRIAFTVGYYFTEQWWFYGLLIIGIGALIVAAIHIRTKVLKKAVDDRTSSLNDSLEKIISSNMMLEEANLFKSKLLSVLMHDIAVPISSIEMVSGMLHTKWPRLDNTTREETLQEINNTARQLMLLSEQLIQWAKIQGNIAQPAPTHFSLRPVAEEVERDLAAVIKWRGNQFVNHVSADFSMLADQLIIGHLLFNIIISANKFTNEGTIEVGARKEMGPDKRETAVVISVKDNGTGMPEYLKDQLLQSVSQASHAGTMKEKGWGLGYQIILDLLLLINGKIDIDSKEDGTLVTITIPVPVPK